MILAVFIALVFSKLLISLVTPEILTMGEPDVKVISSNEFPELDEPEPFVNLFTNPEKLGLNKQP